MAAGWIRKAAITFRELLGLSGEALPAFGGYPVFSTPAASYVQLYRTQPAVRTVVDFLARNVAQLGLHVYRRSESGGRTRVRDHDLARLLDDPNGTDTAFRFIERIVQDVGIFGQAFLLKVRDRDALRLVRLPAEAVAPAGGLLPTGYLWRLPDQTVRPVALSEVIHFRLYDPSNPLVGLSPLETLRRVLTEESALSQYREWYWKNAARMSGIIERPATAGRWTDEQRIRFRESWERAFTGARNAGRTVVLEDGMAYKEASYSARDSQLHEARQLTREEVARAYHVPLAMVGILEHATYSNVREQHRQLYADCLGPWLEMIQAELEAGLVPEWSDGAGLYLEFNVSEKLKGSFEEQAAALRQLCGVPVLTVNEARERLNLPRIADAAFDRPVVPLNVQADPPGEGPAAAAPVVDDPALEGAAVPREWIQ